MIYFEVPCFCLPTFSFSNHVENSVFRLKSELYTDSRYHTSRLIYKDLDSKLNLFFLVTFSCTLIY